MPRIGSLIICMLFLVGCVSPEPKITKRYETLSFDQSGLATQVSTAEVSLFSLALESPSAKKTIFDLGERAQAALIQEVGKANLKPAQLMSAVGGRLGQSAGAPKDQDLTIIRRRIVLTVQNTSHRPADRIQRLRATITPQSGVSFRDWDKATTAYETIDLGNLEYTQTRSAEIKGGFAPGPASSTATLDFTGKSENSLKENLDLKKRIIDLNVAVKPTQAVVERQGALDRDLEGNVTVDFTFKAPAAPSHIRLRKFGNFFAAGNQAAAPDALRMYTYDVTYPLSGTAVRAHVAMDYDIREVPLTSGDSTVDEGDDRAKIVTGRTSTSGELIPQSDLEFSVVELADGAGQKFVTYALPDCTAEVRPLVFRSYSHAQQFYDWLEARHTQAPLTSPISVTAFRYHLCLVERDATGTWGAKRELRPADILGLFMKSTVKN